MRKIAIITAIALSAISANAFYIPIPKIIASAKGIQTNANGNQTSFICSIGVSLKNHNNIYIDLPLSNNSEERDKFENSGVKIIIHDNESMVMRMVFNTDGMSPQQITKEAIKRLTAIEPAIKFEPDNALYIPRL